MYKQFGSEVFDFSKIEEKLPSALFKRFMDSVETKKTLEPDVAEFLAQEIKNWAEKMGATHFTHWFLPLSGVTAGKIDTFLRPDKQGKIISSFSGKDLIKGEPDASSFPHGGMRSTFEARGYTAWDPASPVFIIRHNNDGILYIPSVFFGYNGKVLDKKTPLLRSLKVINDISVKILSKLGSDVSWVKNMIGPEQEFFLVMERDYRDRPDLRTLGHMIFAARPPRGQELGDHYLGEIPGRVMRFYEDVEAESMKLGIPVKTRHGEVAPNQFEIAPIYEEANIAADHNQMLMDILAKTARKHKMVCLLHEKPFPFFNGSGKHINWSVMDSKGNNLMQPGKAADSKIVFLAFLAGFIRGIYKHNDLLLSSLVSAGNEFRLGGHEAPPSVISVTLGEELQRIISDPFAFLSENSEKADKVRFEEYIPLIDRDNSDRNRTSPVAYTGNKFEFRMPGSSASIAFPVTVINLIVADGLHEVYEALDGIDSKKDIVMKLKSVFDQSMKIVFDGDNYTEEWLEDVAGRGIFIPESVPDTLKVLDSDKNAGLFSKYGILRSEELTARRAIKTELYEKTVEMELRVARYMLRAYIIPAALKNQKVLIDAITSFPSEILRKDPDILKHQVAFIEKFTRKVEKAMEFLSCLDEDNEKLKSIKNPSEFCASVIRTHLYETADLVNKIEERVDRDVWPMPRVPDILFR